MGVTRIKATLDGNVISCAYFRDISSGENASPVDLTIKVWHRYQTSAGVSKSVLLEEITILKKYLQTTGLSYLSEVQQSVEFTIMNLRYLTDIYLECHEVRDGSPLTTAADVLNGDDMTLDPTASNPEKDIENDENIPEEVPDRNISDPEEDYSTVIWALNEEKSNLVHDRISKRVYLDGEVFISQQYNERKDRIFVENAIANMIPNPAFEKDPSRENMPLEWEMESPGIIVNSAIVPYDGIPANVWRHRLTNPNLFSAFNTASFRMREPKNLTPGLQDLTFSFYYKVVSTSNNIPFNNVNIRFRFFSGNAEIGVEEISMPSAQTQDKWTLASASIRGSQIRAAADKYLIEFDVADIDETDLFMFEIFLPQLEPSACATTRTLDSRVQDQYRSEVFKISLPFYMEATAHHVVGSGFRGFFGSTTNLKDGVEFGASSDRLYFKQYNPSGGLSLNAYSDVYHAAEGSETVYGIWVESGKIEFYINRILTTVRNVPVSLEETESYLIGSIERANCAANSEIVDFRVLRVKPL